MPRRMLFLLAAGVVAVALAACGGGDDDEPSEGEPSQDGPATTVGVDTSFAAGNPDSEYCQLSRSYVEKSRQLTQGGGGTPDQLRQLYAEAISDIGTAVDVAPDEIKEDVTILSNGLSALQPALEQAGFDLTKVPPESLAPIGAPEFQAATTRVGAYATSVCGARP